MLAIDVFAYPARLSLINVHHPPDGRSLRGRNSTIVPSCIAKRITRMRHDIMYGARLRSWGPTVLYMLSRNSMRWKLP